MTPNVGDALLFARQSGPPAPRGPKVAEVVGRVGRGRWFVYDDRGGGYPVEAAGEGVWREVPLALHRGG
jgi:hypothetical protein